MDPTENLKAQLRLALRIQRAHEHGARADEHDVEALAALVITLDEWISKGGFLPTQWQKNGINVG